MQAPRTSLLVALSWSSLGPALAAQEPTNFGIATLESEAGPYYAAIRTHELDHGQDLDGDGKLESPLALVVFPDGSEPQIAGLSGGRLTADGDWLAFRVNEATTGDDQNGDGDLTDLIPYLHHVPTKTTLTIPLSIPSELSFELEEPDFPFVGGLWALHVREAGQGDQDLNGDGDAVDTVVFAYDVAAQTLVNTHIAGGGSQVLFGWIVFRGKESAQGVDLNGDGDQLDGVILAYRASDGQVVNLGVAGDLCELGFPLTVLSVSESAQGAMDLNGDGDAQDDVLHVFDLRDGSLTSTGVAAFETSGGLCRASGEAIVFRTLELLDGGDLNGDGDVFDRVVQVYDERTHATTNTGLAQDAGDFVVFPEVDYPFVALGVNEGDQGAGDLNGDGDLEDDVLFVYDARTGGAENTGLHVTSPLGIGQGFVFADFLMEGESDDEAHRYEIATGATVPLGASVGAVGRFELEDAGVVFVGSPVGGGPGSVRLHDLETGATEEVGGVWVDSLFWSVERDVVYFHQLEAPVDFGGVGDLNGDGDLNDAVLHALEL